MTLKHFHSIPSLPQPHKLGGPTGGEEDSGKRGWMRKDYHGCFGWEPESEGVCVTMAEAIKRH